jgi:hypothetical protein
MIIDPEKFDHFRLVTLTMVLIDMVVRSFEINKMDGHPRVDAGKSPEEGRWGSRLIPVETCRKHKRRHMYVYSVLHIYIDNSYKVCIHMVYNDIYTYTPL